MSLTFLQLPVHVQIDVLNQVDYFTLCSLKMSCRQLCMVITDNRRAIKVGPTAECVDLMGYNLKDDRSEYLSSLMVKIQGKSWKCRCAAWDHDVFYNLKIDKLFMFRVTHSLTYEKFHNFVRKYGITAEKINVDMSQFKTPLLKMLKPKLLSIGFSSTFDTDFLNNLQSVETFRSTVNIDFPVEALPMIKTARLEICRQKRLPVAAMRMALKQWFANERQIRSWYFSTESPVVDGKLDFKVLSGVPSEFVWNRLDNGGRNRAGVDIRTRLSMRFLECVHLIANREKTSTLVVVFTASAIGLYDEKHERGADMLKELNSLV